MEDIRRGAGFVMTLLLVMEARTAEGNCLRVRRETALNVKSSLTGILLKVDIIIVFRVYILYRKLIAKYLVYLMIET